MLSRPYRLPAPARLTHPRTLHTPLFVLKYAPSSVSHSRCLVVISKAVDKRATKRNELRRCIITTVQPMIPALPKPWDLLFILRKEIAGTPKDEIMRQVHEVLEKLKFV